MRIYHSKRKQKDQRKAAQIVERFGGIERDTARTEQPADTAERITCRCGVEDDKTHDHGKDHIDMAQHA